MITLDLSQVIEMIPITTIGFLSGIMHELNTPKNDKQFIKNAIITTFFSVMLFLLLDLTELEESVKLGFCGLVGFLGFDKAFEFFEKILNIKKN